MTAISQANPARSCRPALSWEPLLATAGLLLALTMIPTGWLALTDPRTLDGVNVWIKPLKFMASVSLFWLTGAWVFSHLPSGFRQSLAGRYTVWVSLIAGLLEIAYITLQASRAEASHFNYSSPTSSVLYSLMAVGAVSMTSTSLVQGIAVLRTRAGDLAPPVRTALGWGLVLTFLLGTLTGGYMGSQPGHFVGIPTDLQGLPLLGWSTTAGDLRPAHFFGMHAAQILPVLIWVIALGSPTWARRLPVPLALAYAALTLAILAQAMAGKPLIAL
jgi:hypothetical protein